MILEKVDHRPKLIRQLILLAIDAVIFIACYSLSAVSRWEYGIVEEPLLHGAMLLFMIIAWRIAWRNYSVVWRYARPSQYMRTVLADVCAGLTYVILTRGDAYLFQGALFHNRSIEMWQGFALVALTDLGTLITRFIYQEMHRIRGKQRGAGKNRIRVAVVGAGSVGTSLVEMLAQSSTVHYEPVCFIDTDPAKVGQTVFGLKVYPQDTDTIELIQSNDIQEIFIAIPSKTGAELKELYDFYTQTGCMVKLYDYSVSDGAGTANANGRRTIRQFSIEDLLMREPIKLPQEKCVAYYGGKTALVTGGGGSIGSEICRQLAKMDVGTLVIVDIYENNAYDIQQELRRKYPQLRLHVRIASVREAARIEEIFREFRPDVVFHAAAHKHVPLMEDSPCEAIKNNVFGTLNVVRAAENTGVARFVMISTDKAVNPTNIMGATKRMCEMIVQSRAIGSKTDFLAVRFGNVLGSNGSVIPLFRKQIEDGGPITLTDRRIIRYFMLIKEAARLVLETGVLANSGDLYVLDMGRPVKIAELAENMVKLSGLRPYVDIDIIETGLRPGEKLYEELLIRTEELNKTENSLIFVEKDRPLPWIQIEAKLSVLEKALAVGTNAAARQALHDVVPTYHEPEEVNTAAIFSRQEFRDAERTG